MIELFRLDCKIIGHHYGKNKFLKVWGALIRAMRLIPMIIREKPDLAVAHGSRTQILTSFLLGITVMQIGDYEHSSHGFLNLSADWAVVPDVIPVESVQMDPKRVLRYPGIKEDVYVPGFKPDPAIKAQLGLLESDVVVTIRPPANEAHYHNPESDELFEAAVEFLSKKPELKFVALPRNEKQAARLKERWPDLFSSGKMRIPGKVVDGLNLIWHSDFVISGGGTMNREAAALGVPVYSIFCGKIGAVDQYLSKAGRLVLLQSLEDLHAKILPVRRERPARPQKRQSAALSRIVEQIVATTKSQRPFSNR